MKIRGRGLSEVTDHYSDYTRGWTRFNSLQGQGIFFLQIVHAGSGPFSPRAKRINLYVM